ncbi:hypothetical protein P691DRAFT_847203 [Macrolepiota fuliginosa MF-IS2]|uniref:Cullin N-terminal domain-containing protein n=1 Tax=Macrolepiota fuliginosa MF-IS2 TaxID=1400762 RepID=A0A9P5X0U5_9AGAR|nr:hypothetical protein P691DRAFT_847203 [Macrolepiota fuliginosa MF-IS2]
MLWAPLGLDRYLVGKCERVLIHAHSELIWECFQFLCDACLLSCISQGLESLRERFDVHVKQPGLTAVCKLVGEYGANAKYDNPKAYVNSSFEVHCANSETVDKKFKSEAGFIASLDGVCREFVNSNAATGSSPSKYSEIILECAHMLLHENRHGERRRPRRRNPIYIEDKNRLQRSSNLASPSTI